MLPAALHGRSLALGALSCEFRVPPTQPPPAALTSRVGRPAPRFSKTPGAARRRAGRGGWGSYNTLHPNSYTHTHVFQGPQAASRLQLAPGEDNQDLAPAPPPYLRRAASAKRPSLGAQGLLQTAPRVVLLSDPQRMVLGFRRWQNPKWFCCYLLVCSPRKKIPPPKLQSEPPVGEKVLENCD